MQRDGWGVFPFSGPELKIIDAGKLRSNIELRCPGCRCRRERRISRGEKALLFAGAIALLVASVLSILQIRARPFITVLYLFSVLVGIIEIRNELVRRRFHVAPDAQPTIATSGSAP